MWCLNRILQKWPHFAKLKIPAQADSPQFFSASSQFFERGKIICYGAACSMRLGERGKWPACRQPNRKIQTHLFLTRSSFRSPHLGHWWCRKDDSFVFQANRCRRLVPGIVNCQPFVCHKAGDSVSPWSSKSLPCPRWAQAAAARWSTSTFRWREGPPRVWLCSPGRSNQSQISLTVTLRTLSPPGGPSLTSKLWMVLGSLKGTLHLNVSSSLVAGAPARHSSVCWKQKKMIFSFQTWVSTQQKRMFWSLEAIIYWI